MIQLIFLLPALLQFAFGGAVPDQIVKESAVASSQAAPLDGSTSKPTEVAQTDSDARCYSALREKGLDYDWSQIPLLYEQVGSKTNMGQYLCLFRRQNALQSFQLDDPQEARATIGGVDLHFRLEKYISTDEFFTDPGSSTPGSLWFAVVDVTANGQYTELHGFEDSAYLMNILIARFGAPFVP